MNASMLHQNKKDSKNVQLKNSKTVHAWGYPLNKSLKHKREKEKEKKKSYLLIKWNYQRKQNKDRPLKRK